MKVFLLIIFLQYTWFIVPEGDYNEEEDDDIQQEEEDDDEDNPNKIEPIPKGSAFFLFSQTNRYIRS